MKTEQCVRDENEGEKGRTKMPKRKATTGLCVNTGEGPWGTSEREREGGVPKLGPAAGLVPQRQRERAIHTPSVSPRNLCAVPRHSHAIDTFFPNNIASPRSMNAARAGK